jgi:hypothetical protein
MSGYRSDYRALGISLRKESTMPRVIPQFLTATLVFIAAGCGTMANMQGKRLPLLDASHELPRPFGGVSRDIGWVSAGNFGPVLFVLDFPLSLIGDIVTLPKVIWIRNQDRLAEQSWSWEQGIHEANAEK